LVGFKEFGGFDDLRYASEHITSKDPEVTLMIGVDTAVYHGFVNCGAGGAITGIGNVLPSEVLLLTELCKKPLRAMLLLDVELESSMRPWRCFQVLMRVSTSCSTTSI
jgi:dihydrodipicolinate synthase/N-acetylneuraminate lyase